MGFRSNVTQQVSHRHSDLTIDASRDTRFFDNNVKIDSIRIVIYIPLRIDVISLIDDVFARYNTSI